MRGEIFTGEKCSQAGLHRGERIKPGDFQIQKYTSIDGHIGQGTSLLSKLYSTINHRYATDSFYYFLSISVGGERFSIVFC